MKNRIIPAVLFVVMILSISSFLAIQGSNLNKPEKSRNNQAWAALTCKAKSTGKESFIMGAAGVYVSSCASCAAAFCWGGPAGIAAGVVVGL